MTAAIIMGGLAAGGTILGSMGSASQSSASSQAQTMANQRRDFEARLANDKQNRQKMRALTNQYITNRAINESAQSEYVMSMRNVRQQMDNQRAAMGAQEHQASAALTSNSLGRGLGGGGTAGALMRQAQAAFDRQSLQIRRQENFSGRQAASMKQNRLAQRSNETIRADIYMGGDGVSVDNSKAIMTNGLIQAGFGAAQTGVGAYMQYAKASTGTGNNPTTTPVISPAGPTSSGGPLMPNSPIAPAPLVGPTRPIPYL